ncbi:MAG: acyl carrier protein [Frankiaceae bacterium]|nr:acyl carrier protein [Frankiaceae bacterium]
MSTTQDSRSAGVDRQDVFALVRDALATVLERDPATITADTTLADLAADSLALVEVAEIVEEQVAALTGRRLHIPDTDLEAFRTVGDAAEFVTVWTG